MYVQMPDRLFSQQVKNKPNSGIASRAFILGAGVVTNSLFLTLEPSKQNNMHKAN
jgi:hypothetical protein